MNRWVTALVLGVLLALVLAPAADAAVRVKGYYRKDGTYVRPHYRSNPDGIFWNNWSSWGNINPYTGAKGYRLPSTYTLPKSYYTPRTYYTPRINYYPSTRYYSTFPSTQSYISPYLDLGSLDWYSSNLDTFNYYYDYNWDSLFSNW